MTIGAVSSVFIPVQPTAAITRGSGSAESQSAPTAEEEALHATLDAAQNNPSTAQKNAIAALNNLQAAAGDGTNAEGLSPEEQREVQELQQTDQEVRAHEQAHKNVGGPYAGPVSYETVTGPDGREYAVAGEVQIDVSPERTPEQTIRKMDIVVRAALAPAEPSSQDYAVARAAQQIRIQAQAELREQQAAETAERRGESEDSSGLLSQLEAANTEIQEIQETQETQETQQHNRQNDKIIQAVQSLNQASRLSGTSANAARLFQTSA